MVACRRRWVAAMLTVATLTAACSSSGTPSHSTSPSDPVTPLSSSSSRGPGPSTPTTTDSSASPTVTTQTIEQAIEQTWLKYWKVTLGLEAITEAKRPAVVKSVAIDPIYSELINAARAQVKAGLVGYGYIRSRPAWQSPPPTPSSKTAVMADCFDGSHAGSKTASNGHIRTVGKPRTNVRVTFSLGADRHWRVAQIHYLKAPC